MRPGLAMAICTFESRRTSTLYSTLLADTRFHNLLLACDRDLADACRAEGCECGGRLHAAR